MAPSTRATSSSNVNGKIVDDGTKRYVNEALAGIRRGMEEMLSQITSLSLQNQVVNGAVRPQNQYGRMTKWLSNLGDIKCNFKELKMEFMYNQKKIALRGTHKAVVQMIDERKQLNDMAESTQVKMFMICVYPNTGLSLMSAEHTSSEVVKEPKLSMVVKEFDDVFALPIELPPKRTHEHRIPLMEGVPPVIIWPYRQPLVQKDAIEAMVNELLEAGVIKPSHNSLNRGTIKDKFPIPVIDELIDELHRAVIFSKLDLSFSEHVQHLTMVLKTMRDHKLFAKKSMYVFGTSHVEYLGYVISTQRVATDPSKIVAIEDWHVSTKIKQLRGFLGLTSGLMKLNPHFFALKTAMSMAPVLALPDFTIAFEIETNASGMGIEAVLQQRGHFIAYLSKSLAPKHQSLSTYEKYSVSWNTQCDNGVTDNNCVWVQVFEDWVVKGIGIDSEKFLESDIRRVESQRTVQPLPILKRILGQYFKDFIKVLLNSKGFNVIFVVVDRLTKYAHFMALSHPFSAAQVVQLFLDTVYKLHGLPTIIISDRDKLNYGITPFQAVYSQTPPIHVPYLGGLSKVDVVDGTLEAREQAIQMLKFHLARQVTVRQGKQNKFSPKSFGLFKVLERIVKISFNYRRPLGFGSIAGGLDHVNPVIRLPIEHGISRVLGVNEGARYMEVIIDRVNIKDLDLSCILRTILRLPYHFRYHDSEPGRAFWGANDEEISKGGIPRVIVLGYNGLPIQPVAPPSPDYIPGPEDPHTLLVPQDEDEREPMFVHAHDPDLVIEPLHPGVYSIGVTRYVSGSDYEEDPEEYEDDETEDGPVDYPMDGGDDDNGDSSGVDADEDEDDRDEDDEDEEEEEHLALSPVYTTPPLTTYFGARITSRPQISHIPSTKGRRLRDSGHGILSPSTTYLTTPPSAGERLLDWRGVLPQTPPVPRDEDEREPMFVQAHDPDYVPEPIYPEYIPLEDEHEFPAEEQPLPPVDSPTAESPGYVTESDPEEDPEEYEDDETEDGPVDYPMDGGDDGDDDDDDSSRDDANDEDEDDEDEEEEAYASREAWAHSIGLSQATHQELQTHRDHVYAHETHLQAHQTQLQLQGTLIQTQHQDQTVETLRVIIDMSREMSDMQAELLALRGQHRRARQPRPEARILDHQDASRDADNHI
ncbi:reverse transcriptase [Tanacetum coccineum]|uniref:Reverse transcriptase n=1 Tax=Tanacetum coccineum TaxID=301880 RepID=A0ABQ5CM56_9ASTR